MRWRNCWFSLQTNSMGSSSARNRWLIRTVNGFVYDFGSVTVNRSRVCRRQDDGSAPRSLLLRCKGCHGRRAIHPRARLRRLADYSSRRRACRRPSVRRSSHTRRAAALPGRQATTVHVDIAKAVIGLVENNDHVRRLDDLAGLGLHVKLRNPHRQAVRVRVIPIVHSHPLLFPLPLLPA